MSKAESIEHVELELLKPETFLFNALRQKVIGEVGKQDERVKVIDILMRETWSSYRQKNLQISKDYKKKLKILTILTCFHGNNTYHLGKLMRQLQSDKKEILDLLLQASIFQLVTIKIDEANDRIKIIHANVREREANQNIDTSIYAKINCIKDSNIKIRRQIQNIVQSQAKRSQKQEYQRQSLPFGDLKS